MHTAYTISPPKNLSLVIESMRAFGDYLIVGTKQGHLLMYKNISGNDIGGTGMPGISTAASNSDNEIKLQLLKTNKGFPKPIIQLEVVPELSILIALSDGTVSVHDIDLRSSGTSFPIVTYVVKGGCLVFALDITHQTSQTGNQSVTLRLAVASKTRLQLFYWKNRKFNDFQSDIALSDTPKTLAWCKDTICLGFKDQYAIVKLSTNEPNKSKKELVPLYSTGNQDPRITLLPETERFALAIDNHSVFLDLDGNRQDEVLTWPGATKAVVQDAPYLLSLQAQSVSIMCNKPLISVQTVNLTSKPRLICTSIPIKSKTHNGMEGAGYVYVASASHMWFFRMVPVAKQVNQLIKDKQFELVIALLTSPSNKASLDIDKERILKIEELHAFDLFCNFKFKESLDKFYELGVDTSQVIGLYGDLLPKEFQNSLNSNYPSQLPVLEGEHLITAIRDLIEYLTKVRHRHNIREAEKRKSTDRSNSRANEIVDTTLVKCYLKIYDDGGRSLLRSMLRLRDNQCHLKETESVLRDHKKYNELTTFYRTRGLHRKALKLLRKHAEDEDSSLYGHQKTVEYLTELSAKDIDLICEFAEPVLEASLEIGLGIFTADKMNVEEWPRDKVLKCLINADKSVVVEYIEFIIKNWEEQDALFHNALVLQYKDLILELQDQILASEKQNSELDSSESTGSSFSMMSMPESEPDLAKMKEKVLQIRVKLRRFLHTSTFYRAESVLPQFPTDCLFEERALLLGSLKRHFEALALHLFKLNDKNGALKYCKKQSDGSKDVYTLLYRLLMKPPFGSELERCSLSESDLVGAQPDVELALEVLNNFGANIDVTTVIEATPSYVPLEKLAPYLECALEKRVASRHHTQLMRGLMHAEHLQIQEERIRTEAEKVVVREADVCQICNRRFRSQVAVVRLRNGEVIHYNCKDKAVVI